MQIWNGVGAFNFWDDVYIRATACKTIRESDNEIIIATIYMINWHYVKHLINKFTFQIVLQFMHHGGIFDKRNSIEVYFIIYSKLDIIPVLFCCKIIDNAIVIAESYKLALCCRKRKNTF